MPRCQAHGQHLDRCSTHNWVRGLLAGDRNQPSGAVFPGRRGIFEFLTHLVALLQGKFTIGLDAAAAAGPVGRNASAVTVTSLRAEVYSYSRSRGFAGVSLDGSAL